MSPLNTPTTKLVGMFVLLTLYETYVVAPHEVQPCRAAPQSLSPHWPSAISALPTKKAKSRVMTRS